MSALRLFQVAQVSPPVLLPETYTRKKDAKGRRDALGGSPDFKVVVGPDHWNYRMKEVAHGNRKH